MIILRPNKMKVKLITICLLLLSCFNVKAEIIDRIIAKVDSKIITLYDLEKLKFMLPAYIDMHQTYKSLETQDERDRFLLDMLINDKLIETEIEKYGISAKEAEIKAAIDDLAYQNGMTYEEFMINVTKQGISEHDYKEVIKKQIEKMKFYARFVNSKVTVTEKEILTFFREKQDFFKENREIGFSHILFLKDEDNADKALGLANDFLKRTKETGSFEEAAAPLTDNSSVKITAKISLKERELAKEFKDHINDLEPGEATGIIENASGYNIIVLREVEVISLDFFKDRIRNKLQVDKREKVYQSILSRLWQEHSIESRF
jgi:parvulin-like peptidyl-prolyl isomerase